MSYENPWSQTGFFFFVFVCYSESISTLDQGALSVCSSTLEKLKGFACLTSESSVGHWATVTHRNTLNDAPVQVCDKISVVDTGQRSEGNKHGEPEEGNEDEEGRSRVTGSEQVPNHLPIVLL